MGFFILRLLEDLLMATKTTYEELEQKVRQLEKEAVEHKIAEEKLGESEQLQKSLNQ